MKNTGISATAIHARPSQTPDGDVWVGRSPWVALLTAHLSLLFVTHGAPLSALLLFAAVCEPDRAERPYRHDRSCPRRLPASAIGPRSGRVGSAGVRGRPSLRRAGRVLWRADPELPVPEGDEAQSLPWQPAVEQSTGYQRRVCVLSGGGSPAGNGTPSGTGPVRQGPLWSRAPNGWWAATSPVARSTSASTSALPPAVTSRS